MMFFSIVGVLLFKNATLPFANALFKSTVPPSAAFTLALGMFTETIAGL